MKKKLIYALVTSCLVFSSIKVAAQESARVKSKDTTRLNNSYGLRVGIDLQNLITSFTNPRYQGIELMGDYRISDKYYVAAELGNQTKDIVEPNISSTASGSYLKAGIDYNAYKNLIGLRNMIFVGLRYGYAIYSQELNSFSIATQDNFFERQTQESDLESTGLSAHYIELLAGAKIEMLPNLYLGFSVSVQRLITAQEPDGFDNHYIPGYGTTNDFGQVSAGYRYFIQYHIPLYKRNKKIKEKIEAEEVKE